MLTDAPIIAEVPSAHVRFYENPKQALQFEDKGMKMLEHLKRQGELLLAQGIHPAYSKSGDEATLCWYDKANRRNTISIWTDDFEGYWSLVENGKTIDEVDFNAESFLDYSITT